MDRPLDEEQRKTVERIAINLIGQDLLSISDIPEATNLPVERIQQLYDDYFEDCPPTRPEQLLCFKRISSTHIKSINKKGNADE